ncbi:Methylmalonate-semialdehyde dehydrogenase [acylating], mitochondrial, partial [Linum perenne]
VFVGDSKPWLKKLVQSAKALKVNSGIEPDADLGPVISKQLLVTSLFNTWKFVPAVVCHVCGYIIGLVCWWNCRSLS